MLLKSFGYPKPASRLIGLFKAILFPASDDLPACRHGTRIGAFIPISAMQISDAVRD